MDNIEMAFEQGRLKGLREANNLPWFSAHNTECLKTIEGRIKSLEAKISGATVYNADEFWKKKARELIVRIINGHFMKESEDGLWYFDQNELAVTISNEFNLSEGE